MIVIQRSIAPVMAHCPSADMGQYADSSSPSPAAAAGRGTSNSTRVGVRPKRQLSLTLDVISELSDAANNKKTARMSQRCSVDSALCNLSETSKCPVPNGESQEETGK